MSDGTATGIDPRYDPQFQRGYVRPDVPTEGRVTRPALSRPSAPAAPPPLDNAVEFMQSAFIQSAVDRAAAADRVAFNRIGSAGEPPRELDDEPAAPRDAPATPPDAQTAPADDPDDVHLRLWFIAGWVLTGAMFAVGASWVWAVYSDPRYYTGSAPVDMVFQQLMWTLAPGIMQVGAVGLVLVTTLAGARQLDLAARRDRDPHEGPTTSVGEIWRVPAVVALIVISIAAGVVLIWLISQMAGGSNMGYSGTPSEEQIYQMALSGFTSSAAGPLALAGLGSVLGVVLLGARHAINRADLSAARAR